MKSTIHTFDSSPDISVVDVKSIPTDGSMSCVVLNWSLCQTITKRSNNHNKAFSSLPNNQVLDWFADSGIDVHLGNSGFTYCELIISCDDAVAFVLKFGHERCYIAHIVASPVLNKG